MARKKYKQKYKSKREDFRKGGRVKAQVGGMQKAPMSRKVPPMSIEREKEVRPNLTTTEAKFIPGQTSTRRGKESELANPSLRSDIVQPRMTNTLARLIPGQLTASRSAVPGATKGEAELIKETGGLRQAQTLQKAPIESKRPDVIQPQERFIENIDTAANNIDTTFRQAPTTGKGSDQMFIGREGEVRPQANFDVQDRFRGRGRDERKDDPGTTTGPQIGDTKKGSGLVGKFLTYVWDGNNWVIKQKEDKEPVTEDEFAGMTDAQKQALFESERGERTITSGRTAEQIAAGEIPEGIIPTAELQKVMERRPDETEEAYQARLAETQAEAIQIDPTTGVKAVPVEAAPSQVVETMEAETIQTPEELQAAKVQAEQVTEAPDVEVAAGEVVEDALAKAAKVDRVAPIEGVEVEIPEGALAERVVGTISEGAKATAAINAGTSLSRITRAKKQLSRAGLSDEDIQEIGNDPEALEDRLADFSEEQRGIIEGLPEEALVSTQINGLLEGIENGEIPTWARPAVAQVEQMLARRGMSASTVGRDSLFNAIIQSAMPIAQSNAQAIQQSVSQQKTIEAQTAEANAQRMQQTALTNAQNVFNMDMAQFSADQQTALSNSKFMQTVGLTEASNRQQATIQNAVLMSQANLAEADFYQKAQIQNAQAFLQMDLTNLSNQQQANVLKAQQEQQRLLSNQAAANAAAQFNAASENQTQQFMTSLATQVEQFNAAQMNTAAQFNVQQQNAREALEFQVEADLEKANAAMVNQINQFNEQTAFERDKFNTANAQQIEQANLAWRRQANTINTAAANQVAMQNAQNAFNMTSQAQSFLWQELRDQANYVWQSAENEENRKAQLYAQALANEGGSAKDWKNNISSIGTLIGTIFGGTKTS
jgi:hypothetical protein